MQQKIIFTVLLIVLMAGIASAQKYQDVQPPSRDSLLREANKVPDDSAKVNALHMLAALATEHNVAAAIEYAKKGVAVAKKLGYNRGTASCYLSIAYCYGISGNLRSALTYNDSAITWYTKVDKPLVIGFCYNNRADYNMQLGNLKQALADCDIAFMYAEKNNRPAMRASVYKTYGNIYYQQKNYDQSMLYYEKAYPLFDQLTDSITMTFILNKIGSIYEQKKNYDKSLEYINKALVMSSNIHYDFNFSSYYTSLSNVWLKKADRKKAEAFALKAVEYAHRNNNNKIQLAAAQTALSNAYLQSDSTSLAIQAASESFNAASISEVKDAQSTSASALAEGYYKSGDYRKAYQYLQLSKSLNDSIAQTKYGNELAALQTAFKVNEKDKEIRLLAKDKELQLQKLTEQNIYIIVAIILAALALAGIWLAVNRYKLKQRMKELELRNQIAADLHDEVGSSLSSIHMLSQMANQGDEYTQKEVLARMSNNAKETMDKMSDIVWMIKPGETESGSLKQRMERFAYEMGSSKNIETVIEIDDLEKQKLSMEQRKNIYLLFKEALNNAVKYSGTGKIDIKAAHQNGWLNLVIKDHGKGIDTTIAGRGNGLQNMKNRAKELGGKLEIESNIAGTAIKLIVPI